jgi:hypothetical protein
VSDLPAGEHAPRVLLWRTGAISELGLRALCDELGVVVIPDHGGGSALDRIAAEHPRTVIVGVDAPGGGAAAAALAREAPQVMVIAYSATGDQLRVFPRWGQGRSYRAPLTSERVTGLLSS